MTQPAHVATKKWNGICITATFILKTNFVSTSMSRLHTSFRDTMKTPTAFNSRPLRSICSFFCEQHNVTSRSINCTTFFRYSAKKDISAHRHPSYAKYNIYIFIRRRIISLFKHFASYHYVDIREAVSKIKALHGDLLIWYSSDVKTRVALKFYIGKSGAEKTGL